MLKLTLRHNHPVPVEAECVSPDIVSVLSISEIEHLPVYHGNRQECLADHFCVSGNSADETILIEGDCSRIKCLGASMSRGTMRVIGSAGMHVGARMVGGELEVQGHAGDWAGAEMRGGLLRIHGNAGHGVGAGYRGAPQGMKGGTIIIEGNAGNEAGAYIRRGLIVVAGSIGDYCGVNALAGTMVVGGKVGMRPGAGMKRASIVACGPAPELLPTFQWSGWGAPYYLRVLGGYLKTLGMDGLGQTLMGGFVRYCGDMVALGKGEIFVLAP